MSKPQLDQTIFVIEDEVDISELIKFNLEKEGFEVSCFLSGEEGLRAASKSPPDLILLDLMLPRIDGMEVCRLLKRGQATARVPILMVTAKGEEEDVVRGLETGADDYLTKPFSPKVLLARVNAILRRAKESKEASDHDLLELPGLLVHPGRHEVVVEGKKVGLTVSEFRILHFLARRPGWVFTRTQIVDGVKGSDYPVTERSVDVQIVGLRRKLGDWGTAVETVRGVGYRFKEF